MVRAAVAAGSAVAAGGLGALAIVPPLDAALDGELPRPTQSAMEAIAVAQPEEREVGHLEAATPEGRVGEAEQVEG